VLVPLLVLCCFTVLLAVSQHFVPAALGDVDEVDGVEV